MSKGKTITIDAEAYRILKSRKNPEETWSDVIKREVTEVLDGPELVAALERIYEKEPAKGKNGRSRR